MAAGNAIATLPYIWGGGHGSFQASGYDCSGSVSYALAAAGLLSSPLDSTGFESWGAPGPGQWITVYANAGHAFMVVAGWRFDTVALSPGGNAVVAVDDRHLGLRGAPPAGPVGGPAAPGPGSSASVAARANRRPAPAEERVDELRTRAEFCRRALHPQLTTAQHVGAVGDLEHGLGPLLDDQH